MGKKYTTDELEVGGHMLDASMMGSLNTIVSAGSHALAGYLTTYTDTTYSVGNGGLTEINFTSALNTKLAGIAASANNYVLPFTNNSANWDTAYGWGNHASKGYGTFSNDIYLNDSTTTDSFIAELTNEYGAFQDNYKVFKVSWSYAGNSDLNVGFETIELAGCLIECWGGVYKHIRVTRPTTGSGGRSIYVYNDQGSNYSPGWRQIWTSDEFNSTNITTWNTAYGWGNHAGLYAAASHNHAQYIVEGGTSFSGVYPMVVRVGATSYYSDQDITFTGASSQLYVGGSVRTPILYDSDNTNRYLDPAGISKIHAVWAVGSGENSVPRWDTSFHVMQSQHWYGHSSSQVMYLGEFGNPVILRGSLRIGASASADSGMALTVSGNANATSSFRAPIFYDSNNTNYYVNPNGESNLYKGQFSQLGLFRSPDASTSSYKLAMGGNIHMYNNTIDYVAQLHFQDNVRFYDDGNDSYLNFKYGDATTGGIKFLNGGGTVKGYVFANAESFGLLDAGGNWAVKTAVGAAPLTLSSNSNPEFYVYDSYTVSPGSSRAPIFYDYNNTAYYLNPYGHSNLQGMQIGSGDLKMYENGSYSSELRFQNNTHHMGIDYQNNETLRFITRSGTTTVPITFQMRAGTITAANFILSSDERKKTKIVDLPCDNIDVSWKSFEMKDNEGEYRTGVIAQELEQKHPEFVNTDDEGFKSVKYIDLLIAKIAELEARLEKLEN